MYPLWFPHGHHTTAHCLHTHKVTQPHAVCGLVETDTSLVVVGAWETPTLHTHCGVFSTTVLHVYITQVCVHVCTYAWMYTHTLYIPLAAGHHRSDENATGETEAVIKVKLGTDTVTWRSQSINLGHRPASPISFTYWSRTVLRGWYLLGIMPCSNYYKLTSSQTWILNKTALNCTLQCAFRIQCVSVSVHGHTAWASLFLCWLVNREMRLTFESFTILIQ